MKWHRDKKGFTLIEVLVSLAIFAFISAGTAGAITRGLKVKRLIEARWQAIHGIRAAMMIMSRDIYLAFHEPTPQRIFGFLPLDEDRWFRTFFKAKIDTMNFTSLAHRRIYSNTHESEFCEIGYQLTPDPDQLDQKNLSRRLALYVDDNPEEGGKSQVLLPNIKSFGLRFFSNTRDRWFEDWDSDHPDYEDTFPDVVEINLTVVSEGKEKNYSTQVVIANPRNAKAQATGGGPGRGRNP